MSSVWVRKRVTDTGKNGPTARWRVEFRSAGRGSKIRYGGSFVTQREALARKAWILGELAQKRRPDVRALAEPAEAPTITEAAEAWFAGRVDVADATRIRNRSELNRIGLLIGSSRVDEVTAADVAGFVAALTRHGYSRGTVKKTLETVRMTLDHAGRHLDNPARDKRFVKLPREELEEVNPPTADHLEAVYRLLPSKHRLPFLWLDWSGARIASVDLILVGDYDEPRRRVRLRASTTKTREALWVELHPVLADALEQRLGPREDRDTAERLFAGSGADALRTSIAKACKAAGVPLFSPHDLRHRRISLLHLRGTPWARIGEFVGQRNLSVTADTYSHVLADERELDYTALLTGTERRR